MDISFEIAGPEVDDLALPDDVNDFIEKPRFGSRPTLEPPDAFGAAFDATMPPSPTGWSHCGNDFARLAVLSLLPSMLC